MAYHGRKTGEVNLKIDRHKLLESVSSVIPHPRRDKHASSLFIYFYYLFIYLFNIYLLLVLFTVIPSHRENSVFQRLAAPVQNHIQR